MTSSSENKKEKPAPIIFGDESLSDVTLVVDDQDFKVHKMTLACRSEVFKAMFFGNFKEAKEDRTDIKEVSVNNFTRLLEIIYHGKISDSSKFLEFPMSTDQHFSILAGDKESTDVQKAAHYTRSCENFFFNFWKDRREMLNIADQFNLTSMIMEYFKTVTTTSIRICRKEDCYQCFNDFMFALVNEIDVSKCQKKYSMEQYRKWANYATKEPFPDVPKKAVKILFDHLQQ